MITIMILLILFNIVINPLTGGLSSRIISQTRLGVEQEAREIAENFDGKSQLRLSLRTKTDFSTSPVSREKSKENFKFSDRLSDIMPKKDPVEREEYQRFQDFIRRTKSKVPEHYYSIDSEPESSAISPTFSKFTGIRKLNKNMRNFDREEYLTRKQKIAYIALFFGVLILTGVTFDFNLLNDFFKTIKSEFKLHNDRLVLIPKNAHSLIVSNIQYTSNATKQFTNKKEIAENNAILNNITFEEISPEKKSSGLLANNTSGLLANNTSGLLANNTSGLLANNTSGLLANSTSGLLANSTSGLLANNTSGLLANNTSGLLANNTSGLLANNTSGLLANNTSVLLANNTSGLLANNTSGLLANNTSGLLANNTSGLLANSTSGLLANNTSGLLANNTSGLLANSTSGLLANSTSGLLANSTSGLLANNTSGLLANSTSGLLANNTSGLLANNTSVLLANNTSGLLANNTSGLLANNTSGLLANSTSGLLANSTSGLLANSTSGLLANNTSGLLANTIIDSVKQKVCLNIKREYLSKRKLIIYLVTTVIVLFFVIATIITLKIRNKLKKEDLFTDMNQYYANGVTNINSAMLSYLNASLNQHNHLI